MKKIEYTAGANRWRGVGPWRETMAPRGTERLCTILTAHCGPPRAVRILGLDE